VKYFVTGATGFVGGRVVGLLRAEGHEVRAIARDPEKAGALNKESMRAAMQGTDGIFHIAGWYKIGTRDKRDGERVNVQGTRNVLELMKELGIHKGVYTSSLAVHSDTHGQLVDETYHFDGKHLSEYDRTKAVAHDFAAQMISEGLPLVIAMPGVTYGPGDTSSVRTSFVDYLPGRLRMIPRGTAVCLTHVDDVARAHILAMEEARAGETYHVCGDPVTLVDTFRVAQEITGIPLPRLVSPQLVKGMAVLMGLVEKLVPVPESLTAEGLRIVAGVTYLGSNARARRELGFAPRPLRDGLQETLRHEMALLGMK
jgi:nucleoside-diphosphate-sugar epimerase